LVLKKTNIWYGPPLVEPPPHACRGGTKGFRYENRHYSSLSAIAVAITGTRWNGLAFFGLTRPAVAERKERPHAEN
jgi:hypothetical protein